MLISIKSTVSAQSVENWFGKREHSEQTQTNLKRLSNQQQQKASTDTWHLLVQSKTFLCQHFARIFTLVFSSKSDVLKRRRTVQMIPAFLSNTFQIPLCWRISWHWQCWRWQWWCWWWQRWWWWWQWSWREGARCRWFLPLVRKCNPLMLHHLSSLKITCNTLVHHCSCTCYQYDQSTITCPHSSA